MFGILMSTIPTEKRTALRPAKTPWIRMNLARCCLGMISTGDPDLTSELRRRSFETKGRTGGPEVTWEFFMSTKNMSVFGGKFHVSVLGISRYRIEKISFGRCGIEKLTIVCVTG